MPKSSCQACGQTATTQMSQATQEKWKDYVGLFFYTSQQQKGYWKLCLSCHNRTFPEAPRKKNGRTGPPEEFFNMLCPKTRTLEKKGVVSKTVGDFYLTTEPPLRQSIARLLDKGLRDGYKAATTERPDWMQAIKDIHYRDPEEHLVKRARVRVPRNVSFGNSKGGPPTRYYDPVPGLEPLDEETPWHISTLPYLWSTCDRCGGNACKDLPLYFMPLCGTQTVNVGRKNADFRHKLIVLSCAACSSELHWSTLNLRDIGLFYPGVEMSVWETNTPWNPPN